MQVHRMTLIEAKLCIKQHKKRPKRETPKARCCQDGCGFIGTRMDIHLHRVHKLDKQDAKIKAKACIKIKRKEQNKTQEDGGLDPLSHAQRFLQYLGSFGGPFYIDPQEDPHAKTRKEQQNAKIMRMVYRILCLTYGSEAEITDESLFFLKNIGERMGDEDSVLDKLRHNHTWGTVRNYLTALSYFLDFLAQQYPPKLALEKLSMISAKLDAWKKTVWRQCQPENHRKKISDHDRLLPIRDIKSFVKAKKFQDLLSIEVPLTPCEGEKAIWLRNFMLLHTSLTNVKRTGILENLQTQHVTASKGYGDKNGRCILVDSGKTFSSCGAAQIYMTNEEYRALMNYITFVRPVFNPETNQVFTKTNGEWASNSDILKMAQMAWTRFCETNGIPTTHLTFNLLRKTIVTQSRELEVGRDECSAMASQMNHSLTTADKIYDVGKKLKQTKSFRTTLMEKLLSPGDGDDDDEEDEEVPLPENKSPVVKFVPLDQKVKKPSRVFTKEDKSLIKSQLGEWILSLKSYKGTVRRAELVQRLNRSEAGRDLLKNFSEDQLYTRVRNLVNGSYTF